VNIAITADAHALCAFAPDPFHKCKQDGDCSCTAIDDKSTLIWNMSTMKQADKDNALQPLKQKYHATVTQGQQVMSHQIMLISFSSTIFPHALSMA